MCHYAVGAWGFDLIAACSGFLYGLTTAAHLVAAGTHEKVLVIGADTMSRIIDYTDRATCVLFGDGAGAIVLQASEQPGGVLSAVMHSDGSGGDLLSLPGGGSRLRFLASMDGRRIDGRAGDLACGVVARKETDQGHSACQSEFPSVLGDHQRNLRCSRVGRSGGSHAERRAPRRIATRNREQGNPP